MTSGPVKRACGPGLVPALDRGERTGRIACKIMRCIHSDLMCRPRPSMHASCSRRASLCLVVAAFTRLLTASAPFDTRAPLVPDLVSLPVARPTIDGLARPSEAADAVERSERACRCYRRTGSSTLDGHGQQGVGCSCVAAVDVVRQLCAASQQAGLVATTAWRCGRSRAVKAILCTDWDLKK